MYSPVLAVDTRRFVNGFLYAVKRAKKCLAAEKIDAKQHAGNDLRECADIAFFDDQKLVDEILLAFAFNFDCLRDPDGAVRNCAYCFP